MIQRKVFETRSFNYVLLDKKKQKIAINLFFVMSLIYLMGLNLIQQYGVAVNDIIVNGIVGLAILKMLYI